jgi:hypothetical protein
LRQLKSEGLRPSITILEELSPDADWQSAEIRWIAEGRRLGWPLTNCTSGGDGVPDLPPEIREKLRSVWLGRKHRPETLLKLSASSKQRRWTESRRELMRRKMRVRVFTPTHRDRIRQSVQKLTDDQVREIRGLLGLKVSQYAIADRFGVHQGTVSNIKRGISYAHVPSS